MNLSVEKREIVGVLKTHFGSYAVLDDKFRVQRIGNFEGTTMFHVVDGEGFDNYVFVAGAYDYISFKVPSLTEVKFLTSDQPDLTKETID